MKDHQVPDEVQPITDIDPVPPLVPGAEAFMNPVLYSALVQRFGPVRIARRGRPMVIRNMLSLKGPSLGARDLGETYKVCCPWCNDSKFRFIVGHVFGTIPESTGLRAYCARCWRCDKDGKDLFNLLGQTCVGAVAVPAVSPPTQPQPQIRTSDGYWSPGECIGFDGKDPRTSWAHRYLVGHGIDPQYASEVYGWQFCWQGDPAPWNGAWIARGGCTHRIIMPVTYNGVEVGWQSRLPFDLAPIFQDQDFATMRWLTMPGDEWRSRYVMGYDQAKDSDFCILAADPINMARQGPPSISALGQAMSPRQYDLIASTWGNRKGIVVMGDAGSNEDTVVSMTARELARRCACPVITLRLPECDPRSWEREKFTAFVTNLVKANSKGTTPGKELGQIIPGHSSGGAQPDTATATVATA